MEEIEKGGDVEKEDTHTQRHTHTHIHTHTRDDECELFKRSAMEGSAIAMDTRHCHSHTESLCKHHTHTQCLTTRPRTPAVTAFTLSVTFSQHTHAQREREIERER